jgi:hypothetical protein
MAAFLLLSTATASAAVTKLTGGAIDFVRVSRSTSVTTTSSTTYAQVPGASLIVDVAAGTRALIIARFTAESQCTTTGVSGRYCLVRITATSGGTTENLAPEDPGNFAFDSADNGNEDSGSWESHAADRSILLGPGRWTVRVQYAVINGDTTFHVDDWHFTVMRATVD